MTDAAEVFVVALARASKRARRYLRYLSRADREDVISTALLWCWENKATYNPAVALDDWFVGAIKNAKKRWHRGEARHATELAEISVPDVAVRALELEQALTRMPVEERDKPLLALMVEGQSNSAIARTTGMKLMTVKRRIARLRRIARRWIDLPDSSNEVEARIKSVESSIDRGIEKLDFAPPQGKECPPCWRCKWFDGYLPDAFRSTRMQIVAPEVRAAVSMTEARKIEIAKLVRAGIVFTR